MVPIPRNSWVYGKFNAISLFKAFIVSLKISFVYVFPSILESFAEKSQDIRCPRLFREVFREPENLSISIHHPYT